MEEQHGHETHSGIEPTAGELHNGDSTDDEAEGAPVGTQAPEEHTEGGTAQMNIDGEEKLVAKPRRTRKLALSDSEEEGGAAESPGVKDAHSEEDSEHKREAQEQEQRETAGSDAESKKTKRRTRVAIASDDDSDHDEPNEDGEKSNDGENGASEVKTTFRDAKKEKMQQLADLARKRAQAESDNQSEVDETAQDHNRKRKSRALDDSAKARNKEKKKKGKEKKGKEKKKHKKEKKKGKQNETAPALKAEDLITQQLEKIISQAVHDGDTNLTLRVCKEKLTAVFGEEMVAELKKFIKEEVGRISTECQQISADELKEMAASCKAVTPAEIQALKQPAISLPESSESESGAAPESSDEDSDASVEVQAKSKARTNAPRSGVFAGIVVVPTGTLANDKAAWSDLKDLIEMNGGKVQSMVTAKVKFVVVARSQKTVSNNDSKVKSAKKHGARIVLDHFFTESAAADALQSPADYMADIGESQRAADSEDESGLHSEKSKKKKKARKEKTEEGEGGAGEGEDGEEEGPRKRKRRVHKRSVEEDDWQKEFRARFGYRQEAKSKPFDPKDPVVPEATFYQDASGVMYNAYLTQTDAVEEEANHTKFYSFKLVEAGGFMKGEKWHLVSQWGKVGAQKPGCDVLDFTDIKDAKTAFHQKFWEKTRNSWEAGAFAFRTVSGKYSLVELSDEEEDEDEDEDAELGQDKSELEESVQRAVWGIIGRDRLSEDVTALNVDIEKMPLRRLKRYRVNEALAELSSIQTLLQKGEKKSTKDLQKLASHAERIRNILPSSKSAQIETVQALKERASMLEDLGEVCVASAMRKRAMAPPPTEPSPSKTDRMYQALKTRISPIPESGETCSSIKMMLAGTQAPGEASSFSLKLEHVFAINRAGEELRFAPFKRLPNRMLLWKGGRASTIASSLGQGLRVPLQETPSAGYIFGKGIYLHDCVSEAAARCHLGESGGEGWLLLCEAALGSVRESCQPSAMRRAPHGFHSVLGKGRAAYDPAETVQVSTIPEGSDMVKAVVGPPVAAHGSEGSPVGCNQYVLFDVAQVRPRYLVQVSLEYRGE